jgi:hypothetical protein
MKGTFEKNKCYRLNLNSLPERNEQGTYLSMEDLKNVELFVKDFIFKGIVPTLEKTVASLGDHVESSRKGIKNQMKQWFFS